MNTPHDIVVLETELEPSGKDRQGDEAHRHACLESIRYISRSWIVVSSRAGPWGLAEHGARFRIAEEKACVSSASVAMVVFELWPRVIPLQPIRPGPVDTWLAAHSGGGAVMEFALNRTLSAPQMLTLTITASSSSSPAALSSRTGIGPNSWSFNHAPSRLVWIGCIAEE